MLNFASKCLAGSVGLNGNPKPSRALSDCSDDDMSVVSREEGLECPICCESFNIVENVPYVLWCGHTLCKNCILGLQWAVIKFPTLPIQLPLFIACPWCNLLSPRLVYKGNLKFPCKNYLLLWLVESKNGDHDKSKSVICDDIHPLWSLAGTPAIRDQENHNLRRGHHMHQSEPAGADHNRRINNYMNLQTVHSSLQKSLLFITHLTAKFPLILVFLLIIAYAIPASAAILVLYILITVLFALPSFLVLYFSYPSLDWLFREIIT